MDIVVTVKQVPDPDIPPTHFKVDEAAKKVIPPAGVAPVMNGYDANALEAALRLKEQLGGKVTVVSLGPDAARDTLKRAIAKVLSHSDCSAQECVDELVAAALDGGGSDNVTVVLVRNH